VGDSSRVKLEAAHIYRPCLLLPPRFGATLTSTSLATQSLDNAPLCMSSMGLTLTMSCSN
jgi:hypothetical protein